MRLDHILYICGVGNTREHGVHGAVVAAEIIEQSAVDKAILIGNEGVSPAANGSCDDIARSRGDGDRGYLVRRGEPRRIAEETAREYKRHQSHDTKLHPELPELLKQSLEASEDKKLNDEEYGHGHNDKNEIIFESSARFIMHTACKRGNKARRKNRNAEYSKVGHKLICAEETRLLRLTPLIEQRRNARKGSAHGKKDQHIAEYGSIFFFVGSI